MDRNVKAKILITESMPLIEEEREILEKYAHVELANSTAEDYLLKYVSDVDIIIAVAAKITKKIIYSAPKLKGIVRCGVGIDNIDLKAATDRKIPVTHVPDYGIDSVADHTFALLLAVNRKILIADKLLRAGECTETWVSPPERIKGFELKDKVLGLIGLGKIGRAVAKRAQGFGMKVIAYDPYVDPGVTKVLNIQLVVDLDKLLKESDFISIHAPLTSETQKMIGEKELKLMKKTACLINVSRGSIVDEKALYEALKKGWIAAAGLDVFEKEPPDCKNPLFSLEEVVVTPHIAWYTKEANQRLELSAVDEAIRILKGELPKNLVNKEIITKR